MSKPVLKDVLDAGLYVVFCGTAVGDVSMRRGAYYAGPGNKFWPILAKTGLTPILIRPANYTLIKRYGLGLTDLAKNVSGSDSVLRARHFDVEGLTVKIRDYAPVIVAFNGLKAAREVLKRHELEYGPQRGAIHGTQVWVLPSTSAAANGYWSERPWLRLARLVKELRAKNG